LIRGVARTAVVAGTATAVSNNVSRRQAKKWSQQGPPVQSPYSYQVQAAPAPVYQQQPVAPPMAPPVAAPPPMPVLEAEPVEDVMVRMEKLAKLHTAGFVTDEEFASKKAELLQEL